MELSEQLKKVYGVNLNTHELPGHLAQDVQCFFLVNQPHNAVFLQQQAMNFLATGCRNFEFYGAYSAEWDLIFDEIDSLLSPKEDDVNIALTSCWGSFEDFFDSLQFAISCMYDVYLLYDDLELYQYTLERLEKSKMEP